MLDGTKYSFLATAIVASILALCEAATAQTGTYKCNDSMTMSAHVPE